MAARSWRWRGWAAGCLVGAAVARASDAEACATASVDPVAMAAEEALVVWDANAKVEHFVRRASFDTAAKDFGFLVPTPGKPELAEADPGVFGRLAQAIAPEVVRDERWLHAACWSAMMRLSAKSAAEVEAAAAPVEVLETKRVAGFDAAVLRADDAGALRGWLEANGYPSREALVAWLEPYVAQRWTITAFKVARDEGAPAAATGTVRMSFATERPVYPYREPRDGAAQGGRSMRLYVVGPARMLAEAGGAPWGAKAEFARTREGLAGLLAGAVPAGVAVPGGWLTSYLDTATKRPDADLVLSPSPTSPEVVPPPIVVPVYMAPPVPIEGLVVLAGVAAWLMRRRALRKRAIGGAV
ncbi:MAG: DUF2330 domain-containing protein [Polyangiaceae bacterium]